MRLLHVVPTYLPATRYGGPIFAVHGLCRALVRRNHHVDVFTTNVDGESVSPVPTRARVDVEGVGVSYFASAYRRLYWSPALRRALRARASEYDVVHLHSVFLDPTLAGARTASVAGVPYVLSPRGMLVPELIAARSSTVKRLWIRLFERETIRKAASIHLTSEQERIDFLRLGLDARRLDVVPNGIDIPPSTADARDRKPILLFLGRLNWKKRPQFLLEALEHLPPAWQAVFAGPDEDGTRKMLEEEAKRRNHLRRVQFIGEADTATKQSLMASASILVLPSISENFGNVVLEAALAELPAAITPEVGVAPAFHAEGAAFILNDNQDTYGKQIAAAALSPELERMGRAARALVERDFAWDKIAARMEQMYVSISESRRDHA